MNKFHKAIQVIYITLAILFILLLVGRFFSKFLGLASLTLELLGVLFIVFFPTLPFMTAFVAKDTSRRIAYVIWGCVLVYILVFVWKSPQEMTTRFYYQAKNHISIAN